MTRDNLVAIADKFQLFPDKRTLMSATELVALVRKQTSRLLPWICSWNSSSGPVPRTLPSFSQSGSNIPMPPTATRVANELMTRILNEDLRDRTSRATDTTKFLSREVQRLQGENAALDNKIAQLRVSQGKPVSSARSDQPSMLDQLKGELVQKNALYSDRHPLIQIIEAADRGNRENSSRRGRG